MASDVLTACFPKTQKSMQDIYRMLTCTKCFELPQAKVFMLGNCEHKYCEECKGGMAGNPCVGCGAESIAKEAIPDLFATTFLAGLKTLEKALTTEAERQRKEVKQSRDSSGSSTTATRKNKDSTDFAKGPGSSFKAPLFKAKKSTTTASVGQTNKSKTGTPLMKKVPKVLQKLSVFDDDDDDDEEEELLSLESRIEIETPAKPTSTSSSKSSNLKKNQEEAKETVEDGSSDDDEKEKDQESEDDDFQVSAGSKKKGKGSMNKKATATTDKDKPKGGKGLFRPPKRSVDSRSKTPSESPITKGEVSSNKKVKKSSVQAGSDVDLFDDEEMEEEDEASPPPSLTPYPKAQRLREEAKYSKATKDKSKKLGTLLSSKGKKISKRKVEDENEGADESGFTSDDMNKSPPPALTPYGRGAKTGKGRAETDSDSNSPAKRTRRGAVLSKDAPREKRICKTPTVLLDEKSLQVVLKPLKSSNLKSPAVVKKSIGSAVKVKSSSSVVTPAKTGRPIRSRKSSTSSSVASSSVPSVASPAVDKRNPKGETPLHVACRAGHIDKARQQIAAGADVNAQDHAGWTPLHEVINGKGLNSDRIELVKLLCKEGCNTNIPGMDNETALHAAARIGCIGTVKCLLSHSASPNVRNKLGELPRDAASTEIIKKLLEESARPQSRGGDSCSVEDDDPAVLEIQFSKALLHVNPPLTADKLKVVDKELKIKVSKELSDGVTHVVLPEEDGNRGQVAFCFQYLFGITRGAWILSSRWIQKSISAKKLLAPKPYEIQECADVDGEDAPNRARVNKEIGNPGLFHGMAFYLYKNCTYMNLSKKELGKLITAADGSVTNREPQPDSVDPLELPVRFHAKDDNHKLVLTSHVILYDEKNEPPKEKKHNMEHIKALKVKWLIDSIGSFSLLDPETYQ